MSLKNYLEKLRILPDNQKKIILVVIVVVFGLILAYFWINLSINRLSKLKMEDSLGKLGSALNDVKLPEIPSPEMPVADQTINWETHINEKAGYEIKYPVNVKLNTVENPAVIDYLTFYSDYPAFDCLIVKQSNSNNLTAKQLVETSEDTPKENRIITQTTIDNIEAFKITGDTTFVDSNKARTINRTSIYAVKDSYVYLFSCINKITEDNEIKEYSSDFFDLIVPTFKFIEK